MSEEGKARREPPVVGIVGCSKDKAKVTCAAADLYAASAFFRAAYAHALRDTGRVLIASAKHGIIEPDLVIEPYDTRAGDVDLTVWGKASAAALACLVQGPVTLRFFCGATYIAPLLRHLPARFTVETPLAGLGIGQRLGYFKRAREQALSHEGPPP